MKLIKVIFNFFLMQVPDYIKVKNEIKVKLDNFNKIFGNFIKIKSGDKPYYSENIIKIDESCYFQSISRWYYGRERKDFFNRFEIDFNKYVDFFETFLKLQKTLVVNAIGYIFLMEEIKLIEEFNQKLILSLQIIKETYQDNLVDEKVKELIFKITNE